MEIGKHTKPVFPMTVEVGDIKVTCDVLKPSRVDELRRIFEVCSKLGGSVSVDEGLSDIILANPNDGHWRQSLQVIDDATGVLIGGVMVYPSWLCRSTEPVASAGYIVLLPETQGRGLGTVLIPLLMNMSWHCGYLGHVPRAAISGTNTASAKLGITYEHSPTGMIPYSVLTVSGHRLHDAVSYVNYEFLDLVAYDQRLNEIVSERSKTPQDPDDSSDLPTWTLDPLCVDVAPVHVSRSGISFTIAPATTADVRPVEALIRQAATEGRSFALDEFKNGYFNRRLLRQSHMFVSKTQNGTVIGGCIFGRTNLCRSQSTPILSVYLVVDPVYDRHLISHSLMTAVENYAIRAGLKGLFVDIFKSDREGMSFLKKYGFNAVGTIDISGFVKNHGLIPTYLFYKQFEPNSRL